MMARPIQPGIKWKKITTEHFDIIYPQEISEEGIRVAITMEQLYEPLKNSLGVKMSRWPIVLNNRNAISNQ